MKPRHAAALALVGWYLVVPPPYSQGAHSLPPLSKWSIYKWFESADLCNFFRADGATGVLQDAPPDFVQQFDGSLMDIFKQGECVATDDPRLKKK
jgi:hypothetical protein